ncbi:MAG: AbgT family transporter [Bacteroidales bacterium]|nr:AbgT family transporter [Bacteroidales bacterium]MDT8430901.1 AbgT family transporter [Bacteroidales bacterium]
MFKGKKVPHTFVIVFGFIVAAAILTWFVPGGEFERKTVTVNEQEREIIVEGSFQFTESNPQTWQVFSALFDGFVDKADIIVFIIIIGGAFWIMNESKAIDVGIQTFLIHVRKLDRLKFFRFLGVDNIVITLIMLVFSIFGAIFGMSEETIAFTIIFIPLAISMGYDSIVGVSLCFVAAGLGFAGALLNPFTIGIAQGLSSLPLFSGIEYRFFCWIVINIIGIGWILRYAARLRKSSTSSIVYEEDAYWRQRKTIDLKEMSYYTPPSAWVVYIFLSAAMVLFSVLNPNITLNIGNSTYQGYYLPVITLLFIVTGLFALRKSLHFFILNLLMFTIIYLIVGVMGFSWYIKEIATLFLVLGLASGIAMNSSANEIVKQFSAGMKDILTAAFVVGLAGGILVILEDGKVIDSLLYYMSKSMQEFGKVASVTVMYIIQTGINIVIPSGSAKAALTMPIMSQFSDLIGISRQATVMAFQFGDGFTNMITPTSAVLIGVLGIARIPYEKWVKWILPFMVILIITGWLLLLPTVLMDLSGF